MQFDRDRWERKFQLSFNRGCFRTDVLYSICVSTFGLSAAYRLAGAPGASAAVVATSTMLGYAPLVLLLITAFPAAYVQHRQPLVAAMKVWAAFVATLLPLAGPSSSSGGGGGSSTGDGERPPADVLMHAGAGFALQLSLHALGLQTTGAWLVLSQGFVAAVSARLAVVSCDAWLSSVTAQLLRQSPRLLEQPWLPAAAAGADPGTLCKVASLGLQVCIGYGLTTALALAVEWRQRRTFAAAHRLDPPAAWSLLALGGCYFATLCLLLRVALAAVLRPPLGSCAAATAAAAAAAIAGGGGGADGEL